LSSVSALFTAVTTFAAVTGGGALVLAVWHLRNRGGTARPASRPTATSGASRPAAMRP
jgi:hypothetical protein